MLSTTAIYLASLVMMGVGGGVLYLLWRAPGAGRSPGVIEWSGTVLSVLLILCAGALGTMAYLRSEPPEVEAGRSAVQEGVGEPAESFSFRLVESNERRSLQGYQGKVVLVNFWATWCPPCLEEMPELSRLQEEYRDEGLVVLTISDEARQKLRAYEVEPPLQTVNGYLPASTALSPPFNRMRAGRPISFIIDRKGILRRVVRGARDYAFFEQAVAPYVGTLKEQVSMER